MTTSTLNFILILGFITTLLGVCLTIKVIRLIHEEEDSQ